MATRPPQLLADYLRRLTLAWLVPLMLVTTALATYAVYQVHQRQTAQVRMRAQQIGDEIAADLQRRQAGLKAVAATAATASEAASDLARWYSYAQAYDRTFDTPVVLTGAQHLILFNTRRPLGQPLAQLPDTPGRRAYDEALSTGEPQVGDVVQAPVMQQPVVPIVVPVNGTQALLGVVMLPKFEELLQRQRLPEGWSATVLDGMGKTIASTGNRPPGFSEDGSAQRAQRPMAAPPWTVVVEAGNWPFYRPHLQVALVLLLVIGSAFIGAGLAARRGGQGLVGSVGRLIDRLPQPHPRAAHSVDGQPVADIIEIEAARVELRRLARALHQAEEAERSRIARELHDGIQQDVAAILINLNVAQSRIAAQSPAGEPLSVAVQAAQRVIRGVRHAVSELRPPSFELGGLTVALESLTRQFMAITGAQLELEVVGSQAQVDALPPEAADCLYRITQECLNNVRKHAQASFVHVQLDVLRATEVRLKVADDGVGLGSARGARPNGFGTQSMVERTHALNGTLAMWHGLTDDEGDPDRGTTVMVMLPLSPQA